MAKFFLAVFAIALSTSTALAAGSVAGQAGKILDVPEVKQEIERQQREQLLKDADPSDQQKIRDLHKQLRDIEKHIKDGK